MICGFDPALQSLPGCCRLSPYQNYRRVHFWPFFLMLDASDALFTLPALGVENKGGLDFFSRDFLRGDLWLPPTL